MMHWHFEISLLSILGLMVGAGRILVLMNSVSVKSYIALVFHRNVGYHKLRHWRRQHFRYCFTMLGPWGFKSYINVAAVHTCTHPWGLYLCFLCFFFLDDIMILSCVWSWKRQYKAGSLLVVGRILSSNIVG